MWNRDVKGLIVLLILAGFILGVIIFVSLFGYPIRLNRDDLQDDLIPQHYNVEFIDQSEYMSCHMTIFFQLTRNRQQFSIMKTIDHRIERSSIILYQNQKPISIEIRIQDNQIIIKNRQWKQIFHTGNYSISMLIHINISNTIKSPFIHQIWSSKYRILFTNHHLFPSFSHSFSRPTFHIDITSTDTIISNLPLNQFSSSLEISQIAFALLHQYDCRSNGILQLCFPFYEIDLFSHIFTYTLNTIQIFESYFLQTFPFDQLTLITVLELPDSILSKPGLVFLDQNSLFTNTSTEQILQQHQFIFLILAYQWIDTLIQFDRDHQWIGKSLARTMANYLYNKINDPIENTHLQIERFISTVVFDSLCNTDLYMSSSETILIEKGEAYLTEYRLYLGDSEFDARLQQLIQYSNTSVLNQSIFFSILFTNFSSFFTWSNISGHPIIYLNSSTMDMHLFKLNPNCSTIISPIHPIIYHWLNDSSSIHHLQFSSDFAEILIPLNPFNQLFYPSWTRLIDELKTFRSQQSHFLPRLLFDSFLLNLASQISIEYPLQFLNLFFQQPSSSSLTKTDLFILNQILNWYRSILSKSLEEKFLIYLRKILQPFCANQLWTKQSLVDIKHYHQQIINEILLELCCSINHSICLQPISNRNDPQILIQLISDPTMKNSLIDQNQTGMLTSFNQLQIPSLFIYSDRIIRNIICQIVRQQNEKYWYDLIHAIQEKFQFQPIPSSIITGLSCAIQTLEQVDYYLNNLCPPSPFKWPCYRNILTYSSIKTFEQLQTIDSEQWPTNTIELIDFFFQFTPIQGNYTSHSKIAEFQSFLSTWLTTNEDAFSHWLDNQPAYLI